MFSRACCNRAKNNGCKMKGIDLISCKEEVFTIADETLAQVAQ